MSIASVCAQVELPVEKSCGAHAQAEILAGVLSLHSSTLHRNLCLDAIREKRSVNVDCSQLQWMSLAPDVTEIR